MKRVTKCMIFFVAIITIVAIALSITAIALVATDDSDDTVVSSMKSGALRGTHKQSAREYNHKKYDSVHSKIKSKASNQLNIEQHIQNAKFNNGIGVYIANTGHEIDGKQVQVMYTFTVNNAVGSNNSRVYEISPSQCLPGYTPGANLSLPSSGYSIYLQSATQLSQSYAQAVILNAVSVTDSLATQPVIGSASTWTGGAPSLSSLNGKNTISFGYITPTNVLAYTMVYGYFDSYPIGQRAIIEWDIVIGDASNPLGDATVNPNVYDYPRIFMHELWHALGFADVYVSGCSPYTIEYGISSLGQFQPRTPQADDIQVYSQLYPGVFDGNYAVTQSDTSTYYVPTLLLLFVIFSMN